MGYNTCSFEFVLYLGSNVTYCYRLYLWLQEVWLYKRFDLTYEKELTDRQTLCLSFVKDKYFLLLHPYDGMAYRTLHIQVSLEYQYLDTLNYERCIKYY